ncbi:MAG: RNA polymerase sigma factor [Deltaproteobacteria bacterium]|nr:RNA polymerase sigma factor [Deltaproteobacteria bacterium]
MTNTQSDISSEKLAYAAQHGDHNALNSLIKRHKNEAYRVALRMCGRPFDAEEILQLALERLFKHLRRYDHTRAFKPWLFRIVANQARSFLRKQYIKSLFFLSEPPAAPEPINDNSPHLSLHKDEVKQVLKDALLALPIDQREAFIFKHIEGLSFAQMQQATGASVAALRVRTHRARKAILQYLQDRHVTFSALRE